MLSAFQHFKHWFATLKYTGFYYQKAVSLLQTRQPRGTPTLQPIYQAGRLRALRSGEFSVCCSAEIIILQLTSESLFAKQTNCINRLTRILLTLSFRIDLAYFHLILYKYFSWTRTGTRGTPSWTKTVKTSLGSWGNWGIAAVCTGKIPGSQWRLLTVRSPGDQFFFLLHRSPICIFFILICLFPEKQPRISAIVVSLFKRRTQKKHRKLKIMREWPGKIQASHFFSDF